MDTVKDMGTEEAVPDDVRVFRQVRQRAEQITREAGKGKGKKGGN